MKNSIKIFKLFLSVSIVMCVVACQDQQELDEFATADCYEFVTQDRDSLLTSYKRKGEIIRFSNQANDKLNFKVLSNKTDIKGFYSGTFWGSSSWLSFCYDRQVIELELLENPNPTCPIKIIVYKLNHDSMSGGIHFPIWNSYGDVANYQNENANVGLDFNQELQIISLDGKVYDRVLIVESDRDEVLGNFGTLPQSVNKLYYDLNDGIVGFDDLDGGKWRLN